MLRQIMVIGRDTVKTGTEMLRDLGRKLAAVLETMEDDWRYLMVIASLQEGLPIRFQISAVTRFVQAFPQVKKQPGSRADICGGWHSDLALQCTLDRTSWSLAAASSSTAAVKTAATAESAAMESTTTGGTEATSAKTTAAAAKATGSATNAVGVPDAAGRVSTSSVERMISGSEVMVVASTISKAEAVAEIRRAESQPRRVEAPAERIVEDSVAWNE